MLSFMQDNNRDDLVDTVGPEDADTGANEDQNMDEKEYLAPAEHGKNAKRTTIILVILFTVGSLCVWFMIKKAAPRVAAAAVSTEEAQIENAIAQLTGIKTQMHSRIDQMLGQFYQFADVDQVGVGQLKKNPFRHELYVSDFESLLDKEPQNSTGTDLQLWSILQTEQGNCCMINDKILYEGDWVSGLKIVRIKDKYVELVTAGGSPVILKIPE
jgi:preprotein translocase subunit SecG